MLKLVFPVIEDKEEVLKMVREYEMYPPDVPGVDKFEGIRSFEGMDNYEEWLRKIEAGRYKENLPEQYVPATIYFVKSDDYIVGVIAVRHYLNDDLLRFGGHIGYSIRPSERKKGYGSKMLNLVLPVCKNEFFINKLLVTCKKQNIGSAKIIEKNGGVLENEIYLDDKGHTYKRYWIELI
ncbi:GNAT family N-acetyltransferase [Mobilitalea sibirica]|uniref:GNAT family N-acetyltransferase n=1 Tax=Mobilitalea sibirica TaxID=1462919 RepID=A0A8J7H6D9_9FIRM|nr:GNAT family N-acetyltransferase [Mobilitalea sibirica]MBH1940606.1 GNAT family N-acetyltransferase [Mobilitalea sibirica]